MKIGLLGTSGFYPLQSNAMSVISYQMTKNLSKLGHEVLVLMPIRDRLQQKRIGDMEGVSFHFVVTRKPFDLVRGSVETLAIFRRFREECDIIHYNVLPSSLGVLWPFLLNLSRKPQTYWYIGDVHNNHYGFSIFRLYQACLDKIIAACDFIYRLLRQIKIPLQRLSYIPTGVDIESFDLTDPVKLEGQPSILYVGRLHWDKDLTTLFRAFCLVKKSLPSSRLHVIGSGPMEAECKLLLKALGICQETVWHGPKDNLELPQFYKGCDLVVYPISQYFTNGMGLVAMEALAARKPLVTTAIPGNREFLQDGENALLCTLQNHEALARKILEICYDTRLAKRISTNGYYFIRHFDWKYVIAEFDKLWQELI